MSFIINEAFTGLPKYLVLLLHGLTDLFGGFKMFEVKDLAEMTERG